ncbi:MAG TPA: hypothetical protein VK698_08235 [Kofleriaceae bacterium]|nr:hypothetical protein [Kofleriaceae bacterium]
MMNLKKKLAGILTITTFAGALAGTSLAGSPSSAPAKISDYAASGAQVEVTRGGEANFLPVLLAGFALGLMAAEALEDAQESGCAIRCGVIGLSSEKILDQQ